MRRQASSDATDAVSATALPLRSAYVDEQSGRLVIGIDRVAESERATHERTLRTITGDADIEVHYVHVVRDACPNKKQECRPLRGGVRMNSDATLNLVIVQTEGGQRAVQTLVSGHAVGKAGADVGQPGSASPYGKVLLNPPLTNRRSDAALTSIRTGSRGIENSPYTIWRGQDEADYIVNDFAISDNTPEFLRVYMQGAMRDGLSEGRIERKNVTVSDSRGTLTGQIRASYEAVGGDSGAPVFYRTTHGQYVVYVGIHAGHVEETDGTTWSFYSPWEGIRDDLGLTLRD